MGTKDRLQQWMDELPDAQRYGLDLLLQGNWFDEFVGIVAEQTLNQRGDEFLRELGYQVEEKNAASDRLAARDRLAAEDERDKLAATIAALRAKIIDGGTWHTDELLEVLDGAWGDVTCVRVPVGPGGAIDEKHVDAALQNLDAQEGVILVCQVPK